MNKYNSHGAVNKKHVSIITAFSESTVKDLLNIQTEHMLKQLNSAILRCRALSQIHGRNGTIKNQLKYIEAISNQLSEITGQEIRLLKFYKNKLIDSVDKNISEVSLMSVLYRVTDGEKVSVVNVQKNDVNMRPPQNKKLHQEWHFGKTTHSE
ncbi:hypothetical protein [Neptunomonas sp.]|uniref:hypothetical protein n=1 Tax=Neptunomonas sp. TaxID=1971898 RepID=UPI003566E1D6